MRHLVMSNEGVSINSNKTLDNYQLKLLFFVLLCSHVLCFVFLSYSKVVNKLSSARIELDNHSTLAQRYFTVEHLCFLWFNTFYNHYLIKIEWRVECGVYGVRCMVPPVSNLNGISIGFKLFSVSLRVRSNEMSIRTCPILIIIMKYRILELKYRCYWPDTGNQQPNNKLSPKLLSFCWKSSSFFCEVFSLLRLLRSHSVRFCFSLQKSEYIPKL